MRSFSFLATSSIALIQSAGASCMLLTSDGYLQHTRRSINVQVQEELASAISQNSTITSPCDSNWLNATERYMQNVQPQVQLVVRPGIEDDVAKIVQVANKHNISFYAVSRGHAWTTSVGAFNGIEIDLGNLNSIHINSNNKTAQFGGGVYSDKVVSALWDQGFVTATGGCNCVSILGPALGGGHGLQQGKHGLTSDHFVNLNVVLADGTAVRVSENSNPDLWWAMRGAGHNFGIVTSFESKIWPDQGKTYYVRSYQFAGNSHDALIKQVNKFQGNGTLSPPWLANLGIYGMNTTLSETEAVLRWIFLYDGPKEDALPGLKPFDDLQPLSVSEATIPYKSINIQVGGSVDGYNCEPNKTHIVGTSGLETYNVTSMRAIYDLYNEKISREPELANKARLIVEGYAVQGVRSFNSDESAYALRNDNILTQFAVRFDSSDDPLIDFATEWRNQTIALWNAGQPERKPTVYVNYAAGYESLEEMYGHEPWRLEKLRGLKSKYDPQNRFSWYNPIIPPHVVL